MMLSKPSLRRIFAALALYGIAVGSVLFWNDWQIDRTTLGINLATATAGLAFLHLRWREKEKHALTPRKMKEIFS